MKRAVLFFTFWISLIGLKGQTSSLFEVMNQDPAFDLFLTTDWKELHKKKEEKAYMPAHLSFVSKSGDSISIELKVRTRGNKRLDICSFPPLKLKIEKTTLEQYALKPHNELSVVSNCHKSELYSQLVLREYLAYKLYQEISPFSYRTQLVHIHCLNPDGTPFQDPSTGFIIEDIEELADRLNAKRVDVPVISRNGVDRKSLLRVALFQYMIGNTDWFIKNRHNLEFIGVPDIPFLVTVPYDFDYSGLVGAPYAAHHESLKTASILTRYYQGKCEPKEDVESILKEFLTKKEIILKIAREVPGIDKQSQKYVVDYLSDFFDIIENPKKVEQYILSHC